MCLFINLIIITLDYYFFILCYLLLSVSTIISISYSIVSHLFILNYQWYYIANLVYLLYICICILAITYYDLIFDVNISHFEKQSNEKSCRYFLLN